jgi:hypothetical protein
MDAPPRLQVWAIIALAVLVTTTAPFGMNSTWRGASGGRFPNSASPFRPGPRSSGR